MSAHSSASFSCAPRPVTEPGTVRVSGEVTGLIESQRASCERLPDFQAMHSTMRTSNEITSDPLCREGDSTAREVRKHSPEALAERTLRLPVFREARPYAVPLPE